MQRTRLAALGALALCLGLALLLAARSAWWEESPAPDSTGPGSLVGEDDSVHLEPPSEASEGAQREQIATAFELEAPLPATAPEFVGPPAGGALLSGTAIRIDSAGQEHGEEHGTFLLAVWNRDSSGEHRVDHPIEVRDGHWEVFINPGHRLSAGELILGERPCVLEMNSWEFTENHPLELRGRNVTTVSLHVLSKSTGEELEGVVLLGMPPGEELADFPSERSRLAPYLQDATSPLALDPSWFHLTRRTDSAIWVGAPGHAWRALAVDHRSEGSREVRLEPGGELEVLLPPKEHRQQRWLRLTRSGSDPMPDPMRLRSLRLTSGNSIQLWSSKPVILDGLEATTWEVELYRQESPPPNPVDSSTFNLGPVTIARASCQVVGGIRTVLDLRGLPRDDAADSVRVSGTVELLPATPADRRPRNLHFWKAGRSMFETATDVAIPLTGDPPFAWEAELPAPGSWWVMIRGTKEAEGTIQLVKQLAVEPEGLARIRLRPPELCEVSLSLSYEDSRLAAVIDPQGHRLPMDGLLSWAPAGVLAGSTFEVAPPGEAFEFLAPVGPITVWTCRLARERHDLLLRPGRNEFTVDRQPVRGVRFELFDGQARVPWNARLGRARFTPRDATGGPVGVERGSVRFNEPGSYSLRLESMRDFEDVLDLPFEVPDEGWKDVPVPLRRRQ